MTNTHKKRNPAVDDPRVALFRPEWFFSKKVLDVGCSAGDVLLYIGMYAYVRELCDIV